MNVIFHDIEQNTEQWAALRRGAIGASQVDALFMGESTEGYNSLLDALIHDRLTDYEMVREPSSFWMNYGHEFEPRTEKWYIGQTMNITENGGIFKSADGWLCASPDRRIFGANAGVEFKSVKGTTLVRYARTGVIPRKYLNQIHHQIWVCGFDYVDFCAHAPGLKPFIKRVERDETAIAILNQKLSIIKAKAEAEIIKLKHYRI